jgi:hypothetical protein
MTDSVIPKLDLVEVQVRWDKRGSKSPDDYTCLSGRRNINHHLGTGFFVSNGIILPAVLYGPELDKNTDRECMRTGC